MFGPPVRADVIIFARDGRSIMDRPLDSDEPVKNFYADPELIRRAFKIFDEAGIEARLANRCRISIEGTADALKFVLGLDLTYFDVEEGGSFRWRDRKTRNTHFPAVALKSTPGIFAAATLTDELLQHSDLRAATAQNGSIAMHPRDLLLGEVGHSLLGSAPPRVENGIAVDEADPLYIIHKEALQAWSREAAEKLPTASRPPPTVPPSVLICEPFYLPSFQRLVGNWGTDMPGTPVPVFDNPPSLPSSLVRGLGPGEAAAYATALLSFWQTFGTNPPNSLDNATQALKDFLEVLQVLRTAHDRKQIRERIETLVAFAEGSGIHEFHSRENVLGRVIENSRNLAESAVGDLNKTLKTTDHAAMVATAAAAVGPCTIRLCSAERFWQGVPDDQSRVVMSASFQPDPNIMTSQLGTSSRNTLRVQAVPNKDQNVDSGKALRSWTRETEGLTILLVGGCYWNSKDECHATPFSWGGSLRSGRYIRHFPEVCATTESGQGGSVAYPAYEEASGVSLYMGSGNSLSTPIVAAACAILWDAAPELTAEQLKRIVVETKRPLNGGSFADPSALFDNGEFVADSHTQIANHGILDMSAAIDRVKQNRLPRKKACLADLS